MYERREQIVTARGGGGTKDNFVIYFYSQNNLVIAS